MLGTENRRADRVFLIYLGIMILFGLACLMSASGPLGVSKFSDAYFYVKKQVLYGLIPGAVLFLAFAKIDFHWWQKWSWVLYAAALVLLGLVFVPNVGIAINHSRSWVGIGSFSFQPAECAKLVLIIMLAHVLTSKQYDWDDWQSSILPVLGVIAPAFLLVLAQPDVGTLSIMAMSVFAMLYVAGVPSKYLTFLVLAGVVSLVGLVVAAPYRAQRFTTFLHPELDPQGVGYQMNQAFLAVGSGGFWGLGFGHSRQKFQYLPEVNADSIFAVIAEEVGFIWSAGLIVLILLITFRGLKIAKGSPDAFGGLLASGIMIWFAWQSFLNIGAMVGALPLTGVPLPFVSHGGTALMMELAAFGLITNISKFSKLT